MATTPLQDPYLRDVPTVDGYKVLEPAVLVEKLPEGGMAAVYRGMHLDLKVEVAVKVLKRSGESNYSPQAVARFRQEAEQAARLNDPNLVRIYDFPANRLGLLYLVMEYVDGETLESRIHRKGRLGAHEAATIALLSTKGLHTAHAEGVIHRDIKPPNLLISKKGKVKVTDLGIAKAQDSAAMGMTQEITLLGTPQYMSPELWRGARFASAASDVFAMGATLAFMVTGRHVLDGADTQEIMHRVLTEGFPDIRQLAADVPPALSEVIRLCTLSDPRQRITVDGLIERLNAILMGYGGEYPMPDPKAGATVQPLTPTRFPSRGDLEVIRKKIDEIDAAAAEPKPVPRTMRVTDDPQTAAVAMQAFLGSTPPTLTPAPRTPPPPPAPRAVPQQAAAQIRQPPLQQSPQPQAPQQQPRPLAQPRPQARTPVTAAAHPPAQVYYGPNRKIRKARGTSGVGGALLVLLLLVMIAASGVFAVQQGWLADLQTYLAAGKPATQPPTQPSSQPSTRPATQPAHLATTTDAGVGAISIAAAKPVNPLTKPSDVAATRPSNPLTKPIEIVSPQPIKPDPLKPKDVKPPDVKPADVKPADVNAGMAVTQYQASRKALQEDVRLGQWQDVLSRLAELRRLAAVENSLPDYVSTVDGALLAFRGEKAVLSVRRAEFPTLESQLQPAYAEGSGIAALLMAECWLDYEGAGAAKKLRTLDDANGFSHVIRYLEQVKPESQQAAQAQRYLQDARLRHVDFLADKKAWQAMVEWLGEIPFAQLSKQQPEFAGRAMQTVGDQLRRLWMENKDLAERQRVTRDSAPLAPFAAAGNAPAAILIAEGLLRYQGEGPARKLVTLDKEKGFDRIIELCEMVRKSATDPAIVQAATSYLFDAVSAGVRDAAGKGAWDAAIAHLVKGQALVADQIPAWNALAEKTLMEFRAGVSDLEKRRQQYPDLVNQLEPLAAAKVYAAMLAQAERYMKFEGDPPRATPTAGDDRFQITRDLVSKVISAPGTPADVRTAAKDREWDIYAYFARQSLDEQRIDRILDKLKLVAICAANDTREADYGKLVDELLPPTDPKYAIARTELAEHRMQVVENNRGLRAVSQGKASVLSGVRAMLMATRDSIDAKARARANALLGELELASGQKTPAGLAFFKDGCRVERQGELADPVALMGLALYWSLSDTDLQADVYKDPMFEELRQITAPQRTLKTLALYAEAARSGDPFANFLAGQYTWLALKRTPENTRRAQAHLKAAIDRKHKRAAQYLEIVQAGGQ